MANEQTVEAQSSRSLLDHARRTVSEISTEEAQARWARGEVDLLLDVREADEWERGHIPGAVHAVRGMLEWYADPTTPYAKPELANKRDARIIVHCASGGRSLLAAETLQALGYGHVVSMAGGFKEWSSQGFPVE